MRRLPPLAALRAFEAAARHLSFKRAAAELAVTPTAISHQIRLLEDTIGLKPIFDSFGGCEALNPAEFCGFGLPDAESVVPRFR
jgi:hypothetical protein